MQEKTLAWPESRMLQFHCLSAFTDCISSVSIVKCTAHQGVWQLLKGCWVLDVPVMLEVELWRLAVTILSLLCRLSCPTSTTWVCSRGVHHFTVYLGPTGTRLLMSGGPLVDKHIVDVKWSVKITLSKWHLACSELKLFFPYVSRTLCIESLNLQVTHSTNSCSWIIEIHARLWENISESTFLLAKKVVGYGQKLWMKLVSEPWI